MASLVPIGWILVQLPHAIGRGYLYWTQSFRYIKLDAIWHRHTYLNIKIYKISFLAYTEILYIVYMNIKITASNSTVKCISKIYCLFVLHKITSSDHTRAPVTRTQGRTTCGIMSPTDQPRASDSITGVLDQDSTMAAWRLLSLCTSDRCILKRRRLSQLIIARSYTQKADLREARCRLPMTRRFPVSV